MSNTNINEMFKSIKDAVKKNKSEGSAYKDIIKMTPGNTYTVRLVPNIKEPDKTFIHYYSYHWSSLSTGEFISLISPRSWNQRDPIAENYFATMKNGTDVEKEKVKKINRKENWICNVYVVNDPTTPENNGKIKVLRYGRQVDKVIKDAMEGEEAEAIGSRMFDLSPNGCDLKIKVEKQGEYPVYTATKFSFPGEAKGITTENMNDFYNNIINLTQFVQCKSFDEIKSLFDVHFNCKAQGSKATQEDVPPTPPVAKTEKKEANTSPFVAEKKANTPKAETKTTSIATDNDEEIEAILAGLNS